MRDEGGISIGEALKTNSALTSLYLSGKGCDINKRKWKHVLKCSGTGNKIEKQGVQVICEALKSNCTLTKLDLSGSV